MYKCKNVKKYKHHLLTKKNIILVIFRHDGAFDFLFIDKKKTALPSVHIIGVGVAAVQLDIVHAPRGEGVRVLLQVTQDTRVPSTRVVP
jgi:hypothetical protein